MRRISSKGPDWTALSADWALAIQWLTRLPWPYRHTSGARPLAGALWAFPLVGGLTGAGGGLVLVAAEQLGASANLAAVLAVAVMVLATGALHEDGWADFCDGLGARGDFARRIAAMRDSRLGAFGVIGLILALLLRVHALAMLSGAAVASLALAAGLGRAAIGIVMLAIRPASETGAGAAAGRASVLPVLAGFGAIFLIGLLSAGLSSLLVAALAFITAILFARIARRVFGGYTGDVLGAVSVAVETVALIAFALLQSPA